MLVDYVALAIRLLPDGRTHCGIIYRQSENGPHYLMHFAEHFDLRVELPNSAYYYEEMALDTSDRKYIAAVCGLVALKNPKIPYGFSSKGIVFDPVDGKLIQNDQKSGLTCASFIVKILESVGFTLFVEHEWPVGFNEEWGLGTIKRLKTIRVESRYLKALKAGLHTIMRFRPEEVVGSARLSPWPVGFVAASQAAAEVVEQLS